jgi:hypothetical protein
MSKFMRPQAIKDDFVTCDWDGVAYHVPSDVESLLDDDVTITDRHEDKWFSRLSAPGYLDCTDWEGPYDTKKEALKGLYEIYGQDDESYDDFIEDAI